MFLQPTSPTRLGTPTGGQVRAWPLIRRFSTTHFMQGSRNYGYLSRRLCHMNRVECCHPRLSFRYALQTIGSDQDVLAKLILMFHETCLIIAGSRLIRNHYLFPWLRVGALYGNSLIATLMMRPSIARELVLEMDSRMTKEIDKQTLLLPRPHWQSRSSMPSSRKCVVSAKPMEACISPQ
ncbi:hypothetical protein K437DRAFT_183890 [Tilletiaria anomala UBC 951]|uniref:Uncharacterized protein n=1 Tax=Tilletiaria anomala (strain ATCC 24038 / CBS 436.72 / UBC 951) TaxID=1037660 RepID=A0A066VGC8_TILAU|nr:uncharacterized protein K437DRAFT_183890 [Tilletiaria anomala UBC 951]KDN40787.1 hypothetical protein K437DRAFT_183890 [Tilletiaria anomala UBC 951]